MNQAKRIYQELSSMTAGVVLLLLIALISGIGSIVFPDAFFRTTLFKLLLLLLFLNISLCTVNKMLRFVLMLLSKKPGLSRHSGILLLHAGIIFILAGGTIFASYGQSVKISIASGKTVDAPLHLDKALSFKLNTFKIALNQDGSPAQFYSDVNVLQEGEIKKRQVISVNHPLQYQGVKAYQESFGYLVKAQTLTSSVKGPQQWLEEGQFIKIPGTKRVVRIYRFFPDFGRTVGMYPTVMSTSNPRIVYSVYENNKLLGVGAAEIGSQIEIDQGQYVVFNGVDPYTVLKLKTDPGLALVLTGSSLFVLGLSMALFLTPFAKERKSA
jgi:cytochrome c biogenesis protein